MFRLWVTVVLVVAAGASAQRFADGTPHFWPDGAAPPPGADLAPPQELAGFTFGASAQAARQACERAGHRWSPGPLAVCSGVARDPGFDAKMRLRFCDGALCEATAIVHGDTAAAYGLLLRALKGAFGPEAHAQVRAEPSCQRRLREGRGDGCDTASARHYWSPGGFELLLRLDYPRGNGLKVVFRAPTRVRELSATSD